MRDLDPKEFKKEVLQTEISGGSRLDIERSGMVKGLSCSERGAGDADCPGCYNYSKVLAWFERA